MLLFYYVTQIASRTQSLLSTPCKLPDQQSLGWLSQLGGDFGWGNASGRLGCSGSVWFAEQGRADPLPGLWGLSQRVAALDDRGPQQGVRLAARMGLLLEWCRA